ncbi:MAG TPA: PAS-domain containing protein [Stellaceae bacterium]|nr:PAS-domain containing protein [Stellaceae bacterium]
MPDRLEDEAQRDRLPEPAQRIVSSTAPVEPALLIFDFAGQLLSHTRPAAAILGLETAVLRPGLALAELRALVAAQGARDAASALCEIPPKLSEQPAAAESPLETPRIASTPLRLEGVGYALLLTRIDPATVASGAGPGGFADRALDWLWETDARLRFTYIQNRYDTINSHRVDQLLGRTRWEIAGGDPTRDPLWCRHLDDLQAHRPFRDFRYSDRDSTGRLRYFCVSGDPIYATDGSFAGYRGIARDETDEIEAHQRAASAERLLLNAIERLPDGFTLYDANDRLVMFNGTAQERLGEADLLKLGRTFREILEVCLERKLYPDAEGHERRFIAEQLAAYRKTGTVVRLPTKSGRWLETRSARTDDGHTIMLIADVTGRVRAERKLLEYTASLAEKTRQADLARQTAEMNEARYREFSALAADWEWETDAEFRFTEFSERYFKQLDDYPREQVIGRTRWEIRGVDLERDEYWRQHVADHQAHRPFRDFRYSNTDAKGRLRHFRVSGNPIFAPNGRFVGYRGVAHEETTEMQAHRQAQHAQTLLRAAIDALPQGFALYDQEDRLVMFNRALADRLGADADILRPGRTFEEILRLSFARSTYPFAADKEAEYIAERVAEHRNPGKVARYRGWRGRWIEAHDVRTPDGYVLGLRTDVTERLLAERKLIEFAGSLAEKNRQLDLALANSSNGIAFHDEQGRLVLWNRRYVELYNLPEQELRVGMHLSEQMALSQRIGNYSPDEGARVSAERLNIFASRDRHVFHQTLINGRIIEVTHVPLPGGGAVSTYVDITERERRQGELIKSKEEAEFANRTKSDFLANVSHELRTPLNAVIGFAEMLMLDYGGKLTEKQRDYVRDIRTSGTFLLSIIDDILDLTKIEVNREHLAYEPVVLSELVDGCRRMVLSRFAGRAPALRVDLPEDPPPLEADPRKLRQILINLLTNACKFTPPGGSVMVEARLGADGFLEIQVRDSGVGIAAADLPRVMEPFYRAEGPFARRSEGAGLGLPLAKALTELHGGTLLIESELGIGTTATLRLPLCRTEHA